MGKSHRFEATCHVQGNASGLGRPPGWVWESRRWGWRERPDSKSERALAANMSNLKFILNVIRNHHRILCIFFLP